MAATVLGVSERHMRRIREKFEQYGVDGLQDMRAGRPRARRVMETIAEVCRLKRDVFVFDRALDASEVAALYAL